MYQEKAKSVSPPFERVLVHIVNTSLTSLISSIFSPLCKISINQLLLCTRAIGTMFYSNSIILGISMLQSTPSAQPSCAKLIPSIGSSKWILTIQAGSRHLTKKSHIVFVWYVQSIYLNPMNVLCIKRKGNGISLEPMIV